MDGTTRNSFVWFPEGTQAHTLVLNCRNIFWFLSHLNYFPKPNSFSKETFSELLCSIIKIFQISKKKPTTIKPLTFNNNNLYNFATNQNNKLFGVIKNHCTRNFINCQKTTLSSNSRYRMPEKHCDRAKFPTWLPWALCMPPFSLSWYCRSPSRPGLCHWPPCPSGASDSHTETWSLPSPARSCPAPRGPSPDFSWTFLLLSWHL